MAKVRVRTFVLQQQVFGLLGAAIISLGFAAYSLFLGEQSTAAIMLGLGAALGVVAAGAEYLRRRDAASHRGS